MHTDVKMHVSSSMIEDNADRDVDGGAVSCADVACRYMMHIWRTRNGKQQPRSRAAGHALVAGKEQPQEPQPQLLLTMLLER